MTPTADYVRQCAEDGGHWRLPNGQCKICGHIDKELAEYAEKTP